MALQDLLDCGLEALERLRRRKSQIEMGLQFARDDIVRAGSGVQIGDLEGGRGKVFITLVPDAPGQLGQRRRQAMHGVVSDQRVGDVTLHAMDREMP